MSTEIEKAFRLAREVANEARPMTEKEVREPKQGAPSPSVTLSVPAVDVAAALTLIQTIAQGRDPYTTDDSSRHRPEHNPDTIKALCVVATYLSQLEGVPNRVLDSASTSETRGSMPLEAFLDRIERREILLALETCKYNRTEAARVLGLTFRAMRYKLEKHRIE